MKNLIESIVEQKSQLILEYRSTTERENYPIRLSKNLLSEALTLLEMLSELKKSFNTDYLFRGNNLYYNFSNAHKSLLERRRQIQKDIVLPTIDEKYLSIDHLPCLSFSSTRHLSENISIGKSEDIDKIEFTYFFHTTIYELIYAWSAFGLIGKSREQALEEVSGVQLEGIECNSLDSLVDGFGKVISTSCRPLLNIQEEYYGFS